ncbi:MAG: hypothetical protein VX375_07540 [Pseudomonadota bacterium]
MEGLEATLIAGGCFNLAFGLFHLGFWRLFHWQRDLASLSFINRGVMQILNLCLTCVFFIFAYISIVHTDALLESPLGNSLVLAISFFWFFRAAAQFVFFRLLHWLSWLFFFTFMTGGLLYAIPSVFM